MRLAFKVFCWAILICVGMHCAAFASRFHVLYVFQYRGTGDTPRGTLYRDKQGNLYGTTVYGGNWNGETGCQCGNIFKLDRSGNETVLYTFNDTGDGANPYSGVIGDNAGNLYGTTRGDGYATYGTVFKLDPAGTLTALHGFCLLDDRCTDGSWPTGGLAMDGQGNLFGTTEFGGPNGWGTLFRYGTDGTFSILHSFRGGDDGLSPRGDLIIDKKGNLYGTANGGGIYGFGTVFEFSHKGRFDVLHAFRGDWKDGGDPEYGLTLDKSGNLYGVTSSQYGGCGTIFKIAPQQAETVLYRFKCREDGAQPSGLALGTDGSLYGSSQVIDQQHQGAIFKLAPDGTFTVLHRVNCLRDGCMPYNTMIRGGDSIFGTMVEGGTDGCFGLLCGTVFKVVP
jgi:uncharacterized repeat protein (TIGR03803 family)